MRIHLQYWLGDPTNWLITYSPTVGDRNNLLRESEEQFGKSDESAYSIVPSRMSMSIYTGDTIDSGASNSEESLVYKPLTFENELFTARAYKRNFRTPALQRLFKGLRQTISDKTRSPTVAQEIGEGPDGSEADNVTFREPGPIQWSQNETQKITSRRPEGQPAGDEDTSGEIDTAPNAEPPISFAEACKQGKAEIVETFLESGQDVHVGFSNSWGLLDLSAIHVAAEYGHVQVVEILLSYGADKEMLSGGSLRTRPLHVAVRAGQVAMVRYLLDNGTSVAAVDGNGAQAIHVAAECGSKVILSLLLGRGVTIGSKRADGAQPLHLASQRWVGANFITFVCSQGANIEAETREGYTPLYYASIDNIVDNMKALLELGAAHSPQGPSILGKATERGHLQATRLLLERGADPNCPVDGERTALHRLLKAYAKDSLSSLTCLYMPEIVEMLLVYGANVDLQDSNGDTPLHCLCSRGEARHVLRKLQSLQPKLANILLRNMRDADIVNLTGETALCISIQSKSCRLLSQSLINSGACLLVRKPGIEVRVELEHSPTGLPSVLNCHVRRDSDAWTKRVGFYEKDTQDSLARFNGRSLAELRQLLRINGTIQSV